MRNTREAGRSYYETNWARGYVECQPCVEEKYGEAWAEETQPLVREGEEIVVGLKRASFPEDACLECESCGHPACWSIVCSACGFAPGCVEHDEGHHTDCPERGELMSKDKGNKKEAKVGGLDFEVVVLSSSGDLSKKIAEALEKKLAKEEKRG